MIRSHSSLIVILVILQGCTISPHHQHFHDTPLIAEIVVTDAFGNISSTFSPSDSMIAECSVTNRSSTTIKYKYTGPSTVLQLWRGQDRVATSVDGLYFAQIRHTAKLPPGESICRRWSILSRRSFLDPIRLLPGTYEVRGVFHFFLEENRKMPPVATRFMVVP
jgi:hypothetical protein